MLLADLVDTSRRVAEDASRRRKISLLAGLLGRLAAGEIRIAVSYLSGAMPQGKTGVSPRVEFDVTRLNFAGRDQTVTFQSHVGRLQQRGLITFTVPKLLNSDKFKLIYW